MDLEVVGRHALLFDDDTNASFVNSAAALVEWNSLSIDRYDVRHLLSSPPPRINRRHLSPPRHPDSPPESELDFERYLDLPSTPREEEQDVESGAGPVNNGGYNAVPFPYQNTGEPTDERNADAVSGFRPPFPLPESLLQNLPPTEKVHQIIARTAIFVSKHGGQSEIVLRVKQGDNPTFGFLMPDHHLHSYFRFLIDHPELLSDENKTDGGIYQTTGVGGGGALSLLGSVYGYGEDEVGATEDTLELKTNESGEAFDSVNVTVSNKSERTESSVNLSGKDEKVSKPSLPSLKEKAPLIKRNQSIGKGKARTSSETKKEGDLGLVCPAADKSQAFALPSMSKVKLPVVDPPSDMKRVVDKIVEFILKNGKEFEAVLVEQDHKHGRFPFLLPTNLYYPYYLKVLHKAEESKLPGKGSTSEKHDSTGLGVDKKNATTKESDVLSLGSDIPYESDRKEKFKMVIGKSKKDGQDKPSKATQPNVGVTVDAATAAAILQAATRGIRKPNLDILTKISLNGTGEGLSSDSGQTSSLGSLTSRPESSKRKLDHKAEPSVSVPVANAIAKSAAIAAASEADSCEASLTSEQKLKADRLKRAKVFAAMIKNKAAPLKSEQLRCLSAEPPESGFSQPGAEDVNLVGREREGTSVPVDVDTSDKKEKSEKKDFADDNERRSKRKYRSRSKRNEDEEDEDEEIEEDHKRSKMKHHSRGSSHHSRDRKRHSSSKDRDSLHRHKHDSSSDHEYRHSRRHKHYSTSDNENPKSRDMKKIDSSTDDERGCSRHRHRHDSSSDDEHGHSRHRHNHYCSSNDEHDRYQLQRKHNGSSDDEHRQQRKSRKHRKGSHADREVDLEEGEIKSDQSKASESNAASREPSVDMSKSHQVGKEGSVDLSKSDHDGRASTEPTTTSTEVPDDLRAKIRAMLMATL